MLWHLRYSWFLKHFIPQIVLGPFARSGEGITPVALHASLANVCMHTPCARIGKTWSPCYLHASLAKLCRRTPFSRTGIGGTPVYGHVSLANWCRHAVFHEMGKGVCPHLYTQVLPIYAGVHLFSQNVDRGYALLFTCQSYKLVQAYPLFPQERNRGMPVYLHAALKTYAGIPLFPRNGKRDTPICSHANLPNLRNHMFPAVHVFLSHAGLANVCRHTPLFPEREKGIDLDISLAILADRCQHTYFSRK